MRPPFILITMLLASLTASGAGDHRSFAISETDNTPFSVASVLSHKTAFDRPHDIELHGNLAFMPGKGGSIAIIDVEDPEHPELIWHTHDAQDLHDAETVLLSHNRLLLGTDDFISVDISDPRKPIFQGRVVDRPIVARINGMVRQGDYVIAANENGFLDVFDVSNPAAPTLAGALNVHKTFDLMSPHDVDRFQHYAVVVDPRRFGREKQPGKVGLIELFDPSRKQLLPPDQWKLKGVVRSQQLTGANRVQVSGSFAFVGASVRSDGGRTIIIDLSDPESPRQVASLPFAKEDGFGPNGLTIAGNVVFVAGGQTVEAIDVRRPTEPVKLGGMRFKNAMPNGADSGHDLVYRDGYLYVTGQNDHCLVILKVESQRIRQLADSAADIDLKDIQRIAISAESHEAEQASARTLQSYLQALYGANSAITDQLPGDNDDGVTLLLGRKFAVGSGMISAEEFAAVKHDGYIMRGSGNRIALAGYEPQGTIFAVYAFLKHVGLKLYPNRDFGPVEVREPLENGVATAFDIATKPFFEDRDLLGHLDRGRWRTSYRQLGGNAEFRFINQHDWFKEGGYMGADHSAPYLVPMAEHYDEHPEYYAWKGKGRIPRNTKNIRVTLCMSNPAVHDIAAKRAVEWMRNQPTSRFFFISDGDASGCECEDCRAIDPLPLITSDRQLKWVNSVAQAVKTAFPENVVLALAYGEKTKHPVETKPESNVVMLYCPWYWNSRTTSATDWANPVNVTAMREYMELVMRFPGQIGVYDYPGSWVQGQADRLKFLAKNNSRVLHANGPRGDLYQWVNANLAWDPFLDVEPLVDEFITASYGPAAEPMRAWQSLRQKAIDENAVRTRDVFAVAWFVTSARAQLQKAVELSKTTEDPQTRGRILREVLTGLRLILGKIHPTTGIPTLRADRAAYESELQTYIELYREVIGIAEELGNQYTVRQFKNDFSQQLGQLGLEVAPANPESKNDDVFDRTISTIDDQLNKLGTLESIVESREPKRISIPFDAEDEPERWISDGSQADLISPPKLMSLSHGELKGVRFEAPLTRLPEAPYHNQKIRAGRFFADRHFEPAIDATGCFYLDVHLHATADVPVTLYMNEVHAAFDLHAGEQIVRIDFRNFKHTRFSYETWNKQVSRISLDIWPQDNYYPFPKAKDVSVTILGMTLQNQDPTPEALPHRGDVIWLTQFRPNIPRGVALPRGEMVDRYLQRQQFKHVGLDIGARYIHERFRTFTEHRAISPIRAILADEDAIPTATALQGHLETRFGVSLPINPPGFDVSEETGNVFVLGKLAGLRSGRIREMELDHVGKSGFVINAHQGRIAIAGATSKGVARYSEDQGKVPGDNLLRELYLLDWPWFADQAPAENSDSGLSAMEMAVTIKEAARKGERILPESVLQLAGASALHRHVAERLLWDPFLDVHRLIREFEGR